MSLMTRKNAGATAKQRALDTASQVPAMARNAVPKAKSAGLAARQSAEDAVAWAAPHVQEARSWAAPHVEQAGVAVREKIAPVISEKIAPTISAALVEAANRLDPSPPRRRRWPRVLAGFAMVAAAGSAVAAIVLRRKPDFASLGNQDQAPEDSTPPAQGNGSAAEAAPAAAEEDSVDGRRNRTS
jgi:hypothetical protein